MHGLSKSQSARLGARREVGGQPLAPRSLRRKGKRFLSECSEMELKRAGVAEK